jgi:hypothetical protein
LATGDAYAGSSAYTSVAAAEPASEFPLPVSRMFSPVAAPLSSLSIPEQLSHVEAYYAFRLGLVDDCEQERQLVALHSDDWVFREKVECHS